MTEANRYMLVRVLIQGSHINEIGGITCSEERLHSNQPESRSGQIPSQAKEFSEEHCPNGALQNLQICIQTLISGGLSTQSIQTLYFR